MVLALNHYNCAALVNVEILDLQNSGPESWYVRLLQCSFCTNVLFVLFILDIIMGRIKKAKTIKKPRQLNKWSEERNMDETGVQLDHRPER